MPENSKIISLIKSKLNVDQFKQLHWEGGFEDYIKVVEQDPRVCRTAFQRIFDMILSYGTKEYYDGKKKITKYLFFNDPIDNGKDAIYGLDLPVMKLVNVFQSAA